MSNIDTPGAEARAYHEQTKHSLQRLRLDRYQLDWDNQPLPYKLYTSLESIPLPRDASIESGRLDLALLARLCLYSNGIMRQLHGWSFRAAACTGALYHTELYLVCADLPDLAAGVYHYSASDHSLRRLRAGDLRGALVDAGGGAPGLAEAPLHIVCTSTFWRNSWKYRARAYRHTFWDSGTVLANLFALADARRLPYQLVLGFADADVAHLLGLDPLREAAVCLVGLGDTAHPPPAASASALPRLDFPTQRLSRTEVHEPLIADIQRATSLPDGAAAAAWRARVAQQPRQAADSVSGDIERVIRRRGSARRFSGEPIALDDLTHILQDATQPVPADIWGLTRELLIVNDVAGLESGTYAFDRDAQALRLLRRGAFREHAGYLALGQALAAEAAVNVYGMADLDDVFARFGNRGYRAAQLEAAIVGGRLYLGSYARTLGATGLTFFDDDAVRFFSPPASDGHGVMFLTAIGRKP